MTTGSLKVHDPTQATTPASYLLAAFAFISSLSFNEKITLISLALGICTFFINWWYKHVERRDRLKQYQAQTKQD